MLSLIGAVVIAAIGWAVVGTSSHVQGLMKAGGDGGGLTHKQWERGIWAGMGLIVLAVLIARYTRG